MSLPIAVIDSNGMLYEDAKGAMNTHARSFIIANWKMHGARVFIHDFMDPFLRSFVPDPQVEMILCPPVIYTQTLSDALQASLQNRIALGAQNSFGGSEREGAFTGEISGAMLKDMGHQYVLIGHSERRQIFGENERQIVQKVRSAYNVGLVPVMCVGESLSEREADQTFKVIERQLESFLSNVPADPTVAGIIAYEPVWAIGTGVVATPVQAEAVHAWIRDYVASMHPPLAKGLSIVYGGSAKPESAKGLLSQTNIDGLLIGGASKDPLALVAMYNTAVEVSRSLP